VVCGEARATRRRSEQVTVFCFDAWNHSVTWGLAPSLPDQIRGAAAAGYDYVGLDIPTLRAHEEIGFHPSGLAELLRESGIGCFELVPLSITDDRGSTRQALAEVTYFAPRVGARTVLAVARGPLTTALVDSARTCTETLGEIGVSLAVEFLPGIELNSIDSVRRLADALSMPTLRVMVDSWHFFVGPSTWESLCKRNSERGGPL